MSVYSAERHSSTAKILHASVVTLLACSSFIGLAPEARAEAQAQQCQPPAGFKEQDMRSEFGPIRDQGNIGWCYAFGVADQYGHFLHKKGGSGFTTQGGRVSASALSYEYNTIQRASAYGRQAARTNLYAAAAPLIADAKQRQTSVRSSLESRLETLYESDSRAKPIANRLSDLNAQLAHQLSGMLAGSMGTAMTGGMGLPLMKTPGDRTEDESASNVPPVESPHQEKIRLENQLENLVSIDSQVRENRRRLARIDAEVREFNRLMPAPPKEPEAGDPASVFRQIIESGYCTENQVPSDGLRYPEGMGTTSRPQQNSNFLFGSIDAQIAQLDKLTLSIHEYVNASQENEAKLCAAAEAGHVLFPGLQVSELKRILQEAKRSQEDALLKLLSKVCPKTRPPHKFTIHTPRNVNGSAITDIRNALGRGTPVGITYYSEILTLGGNNLSTALARPPDSSHYSVLVGQRYNCKTGEPEYILRNSWGAGSCDRDRLKFQGVDGGDPRATQLTRELQSCMTQCMEQNSELTDRMARMVKCQPVCTPSYTEKNLALQNPPYICENGHYIISESQLKRGLIGVTYIE